MDVRFLLLPALMLVSLAACVDQSSEPASPRQRLERALKEEAEPSLLPWSYRTVTVADLGEAIELSRTLPISPQQALEAVRNHLREHPEDGQWEEPDRALHVCVGMLRDYYYISQRRLRKIMTKQRKGFFVDAHSGEVLPYPGRTITGEELDSPYQIHLPYVAHEEGQILLHPDDPSALYYLGLCYLSGQSVPPSPEKGAQCLRRSADQGDCRAQYHYALCCQQGSGVPRSQDKAAHYFRLSAEQGYPLAFCELGHCYARGEGVPQSWEKAVHWYRRATEQSLTPGAFYLAECYEKGLGVPQSLDQARVYYQYVASRQTVYPELAARAQQALRRWESHP